MQQLSIMERSTCGEDGMPQIIQFSASEIEVLDTTTGKWTKLSTKGTPPTGVYGGAYVAVGDKIYTYGGWISADDCSGDLHELDLTTMSWRQMKPKNPSEGPRKKYGCGVLFYNDMLVVFGGGQHHSSTNVDELHVYDLKENTWSSPHVTGTPPEARVFFSFAMIDDHKAFLFGGNLKNRDRASDTYILDLQLWHWNKVPPSEPSPVGRTRHTTCCLSGSITGTHTSLVLVMGGRDQRDEVLGDAWIYQVDSGTWTEVNLGGQVGPRERLSATVIAYGPDSMHLLLFGGWGIVGSTTILTVVLHMKYLPYSGWVVADVIPTSQLGQSEETATQTQDTVSSPQAKIEELSQTLAEKDRKVKEYRDALTHSQQMRQVLEKREQEYAQSLAEKELQISSYKREIQAAMEQRDAQLRLERKQREEAEHQFKTSQSKVDEIQLKMNELWKENEKLQEEKEKLQGQLQDAQATLTSEEKQQQLTSPEKSDQAIQTHGEPSYLQMSAQTAQERREFHATLEHRESQLDWERRRREEVEQQHKRKVDELQLQIDELREREKLAGQLQSSQTTGEAALTSKETQEQLSQPEKMDRRGPLPATQATGEATTTTKEIQELTPPEKRDQSVQTYTEPPFLQTSEALQLRGVHVVGETTFTATRHATTLKWEEYGFMLHIPEGALPPDVEQCHIHVKATVRGQFQLPDDHELVSAVFWIWCSHRLSKHATMEIEHCAAIITDKQCSALTFVRTNCNQEELPYTFMPIPEGVFTPGSCYGSISLSQFSGFGIISRVWQWMKEYVYPSESTPPVPSVPPGYTSPDHATEDDGSLPQKFYCAQLYSANKGAYMWKVYFVLTLGLNADMKAVEKYFSGEASLVIESFKVMLEEDEITLDIPEDGVHTKEGWMILPCYPPTITKNDVKCFVGSRRSLPMCELVVKWQDDEGKPSWLAYRVRIKGVCDSSNFFLLTINPASEIEQQSSQDTMGSPKALSHDSSDQELPLSSGGNAQLQSPKLPQERSGGPPKPELKDLVVIPVTAWYDLGLQLDIQSTELDQIEANYPQDSRARKRGVFKQWLRDNSSPSYEQLVKALIRIGEKTVADNLCKEFGIPLP